MPTLGLLVEPSTTPVAGRHVDRALLALAVERGYGALRIAKVTGDVIALGRYHLAPEGAPDAALHRRLSGGRCAATGGGFVSVSLVLPHRSALVSDDPVALAPEQVLNRAVRGLLGGLEAAGIAVIYPGRDLVTVARRVLAVLGFEIDAAGAAVVEAVVAVERDQSLLPSLLERADPDGVVGAQMMLPDDVTSLARELGRVPALDELVGWLRHGYETRLGVGFVDEVAPVTPGTAVEDGFVRSRARRPHLDRRGVSGTMLGLLEAYCALASDGTLDEVMLAGDVIAPSATIARLEQALRGCPPLHDRLCAVIEDVVRPPRDFVLGVGPLRTIGETILRAVA
jgi:hypothetical protein